jgi:hypothetical protein
MYQVSTQLVSPQRQCCLPVPRVGRKIVDAVVCRLSFFARLFCPFYAVMSWHLSCRLVEATDLSMQVFLHGCQNGIMMEAVTCMLLITMVCREGHWQIAEEMFRLCFAGAMDFQGLDNIAILPEVKRKDSVIGHGLLHEVMDARLHMPDALARSSMGCTGLIKKFLYFASLVFYS